MINFLYYRGICSRDLGLYITGQTPYDAPERDIKFINVPGRDGDLIIDNERYSNIDITYSAFIRNNLSGRTRLIKNWLFGGNGYEELLDTYSPDYYRRAVFKGPLNIETTLNQFGAADITFSCHPYRYAVEGKEVKRLETPGIICNPEVFPAQPYIKIEGSGAAIVRIGMERLEISEIDGYLELDFETQNAYKAATNKNSTISSFDFPPFPCGETEIEWDGNITAVEITPRWRTL